MDKDIMFDIVLCALLVVLIVTYCIYVIIDERYKMKYYKSTLTYVTHWDKYSTMVEKQKRVIILKKIELRYYQFLVFIKRLFVWKKK